MKKILHGIKKYIAAMVMLLAMMFAALPAGEVQAATVKLNKTAQTLEIGETVKLKLKNYSKTPQWSSKNKAVAKVSKKGTVTAVKPGTTYIYATTAKGKTFKCKITVKKPVQDDKNSGSTSKGDTGTGKESTDGSKGSSESGESSGVNSYGILFSHKKTAYVKDYVHDKKITNEADLLKMMQYAMENGAETITFTADFSNFNKYCQCISDWSDYKNGLAGYANSFAYSCSYDYSGATITVTPVYKDGWNAVTLLRHTGYEADSTVNAILEKAEKVVADAMKDTSDTEKVLQNINAILCGMAKYDYSSVYVADIIGKDGKVLPAHDATGVLLNGKGVCEAYTSAFRLCLEILGVENHAVNNYVEYSNGYIGSDHVWNRAKIDGTWYHFDITWNDNDYDDPRTLGNYFMLTDKEFNDKVLNHGSADDIASHRWKSEYLPK